MGDNEMQGIASGKDDAYSGRSDNTWAWKLTSGVMGVAALGFMITTIVLASHDPSVTITDPRSDTSALGTPQTSLETLAGFKVVTTYKCINPTCTDTWCDANCNHHPAYCPASFCKRIETMVAVPTAFPTSAPTQEPTSEPTQAGTDVTEYGFDDQCTAKGGVGHWTSSVTYTCCDKSCGTCGGQNCEKRPGGNSKCCVEEIKESGRECDSTKPPYQCHPPAPTEAPTEQPTAPPTEASNSGLTCPD